MTNAEIFQHAIASGYRQVDDLVIVHVHRGAKQRRHPLLETQTDDVASIVMSVADACRLLGSRTELRNGRSQITESKEAIQVRAWANVADVTRMVPVVTFRATGPVELEVFELPMPD